MELSCYPHKLLQGIIPRGVSIVDINKDGKGDIVVCNNLDNTISIILSK